MPAVVCLNGQIVSKEDAKVSIFDHGYLYGDGIFETLRAYGGNIFRLRQHLDRLWRSAQYFHLSIPCSQDKLGELMFTVTRGEEVNVDEIRVSRA